MNAVSRQFEWEADRFALELEDKLGDKEMAGMGGKLGKALIRIACDKFAEEQKKKESEVVLGTIVEC